MQVINPLRVKGPLIALEKNIRCHLAHRWEKARQKFFLVFAIGVSTVYSRNRLHISAGNVPAEFDTRQAELRLGQVCSNQPRLERQPMDSKLAFRIDGCFK